MLWRPATVPWIDPTGPDWWTVRLRRAAVDFTADGALVVSRGSHIVRRSRIEPAVAAYRRIGAAPVGHAHGTAACGAGGGVLVSPQTDVIDGDWAGELGLRRLRLAPPDSLAVSRDGRLAVLGRYQTVEVWEVLGRAPLRTITAHRRVVQAVALSPDGRTLATRSFDDMALWDVASGASIGTVTGLAGPTCRLAFSPDGAWLASGYDEASAALWRVADLSVVARFPVHGYQHAVAFSPDGGSLATAGQDEVVRVWPVGGGAPATLRGPVAWVDSLAFAHDGQTLAATSGGRVHLWEQVSDSATPVVLPPRPTWPQLLATPTGQTPPFAVRPTAAEFIADAMGLPWFARIGQPSDWDDTCVRLAGWNDWSPTDDYDQFTEHQQGWVDAIGLFARTFDRPDVTDLFERTRGQVVDAARRHVPYDDEADGYHPPSVAVWNAAYTAAIVACFLELGWRVPVDLEQRWAWFAAGHWPCDRDGDGPPYRLKVL